MGTGDKTGTSVDNNTAALPNPALSIVIPVYNGADTVGTLVDKLCELDIAREMEIILVVDGSPDHSLQICQALCNKHSTPIKIINLSRNFGEHNAVIAGFSYARGEYIINMDDDLQNPPEEVENLWHYCRDNNFDVAYTRYKHKQHASWRNLGSRLTNKLADWLLDKPRGLYLSSFRCINAFTANKVVEHTGPFPYIDGLIMQVTQNIGSLAVEHLPRGNGKSNYTLPRLLRLFTSMFLNFSVVPLRAATVSGLVIGAFGLIGILTIFIETLLGSTPKGWASLMAGILLLTGTQLIMLGLIGEYLGRMFLTINRKPQYIVRDITSNDGSAPPPPT